QVASDLDIAACVYARAASIHNRLPGSLEKIPVNFENSMQPLPSPIVATANRHRIRALAYAGKAMDIADIGIYDRHVVRIPLGYPRLHLFALDSVNPDAIQNDVIGSCHDKAFVKSPLRLLEFNAYDPDVITEACGLLGRQDDLKTQAGRSRGRAILKFRAAGQRHDTEVAGVDSRPLGWQVGVGCAGSQGDIVMVITALAWPDRILRNAFACLEQNGVAAFGLRVQRIGIGAAQHCSS